MTAPVRTSLSRILGFGFSVALAFGGTVGVGILSLPGEVAAALGDVRLIVGIWIAGGLYALLGAVSIAELAAMLPQAGGFYLYARRAFGRPAGFVVGWNDWIQNCVTISYASLTAAQFIAVLLPGTAGHGTLVAIACMVAPMLLQWMGVRIGGGLQNLISASVGTLLVLLGVGCLFATPAPTLGADPPMPQSAASLPWMSAAMVAAFASALRSVIVTYDGWYTAIYLAEDTVDASRNVPRAMISCALLVTAIYVLINLGLVHALSLPALAASPLPAADAARLILPAGGATFVTFLSLCTLVGLINAATLGAPRVLFALLRDGLASGRVIEVSEGGTPRAALAITTLASIGLVLVRTRSQLIDIAAVLFVFNYVTAYGSLFVLRWREPTLPRPFRAPGFPWITGLVFAGSITFLVAAVADNVTTGIGAFILIGLAAPVGMWLTRRASAAA